MFIKLVELKIGEKGKIIRIDAGRQAEINLMNLGLNIGNIIKITRKSMFRGPIIVTFRGTEIVVGYGLSRKIIVSKD